MTKMMREKWIKVGCFLTGYNFKMLTGCSELSVKRVLRYTSAIVIICILWSFIGFVFASRYLSASWYAAIIASIIMVIIVIQIERQIILSARGSRVPIYFRGMIAIVMATIGSLIIDQIIFKEDIEQQKVMMLDEKINVIFPAKAEELRRQIKEIDSTIQGKENERMQLVAELSKNPTIQVYTKQVTREKEDTIKKETVTRTSSQIQNPKIALLQPLDNQINGLRMQKIKKDSMLLGLRPVVEAELKQNIGFLDELKLMLSLLSDSVAVKIVWALWFLFFLGIEAFVLVSKWTESDTDYDALMSQQMDLHFRRIELLRRQPMEG